jgi:hypothetical protein
MQGHIVGAGRRVRVAAEVGVEYQLVQWHVIGIDFFHVGNVFHDGLCEVERERDAAREGKAETGAA